ncbi:MAG: hypothetical protein ABJB01_02745 [Rudaea sp.]
MNIEQDSFTQGKDAARDVKNAIKEGADQIGAKAETAARQVRRGAARALDATSDAAHDLSDEIAPSLAESASAKFLDVRDQAEDVLGDIYDDTVAYVRDRPISSIAFAALGGAVVALILRRAVA